MQRRPGLKDVAKLAGVSPATVSHVINKTRFVNPETIKRVESAISELHYINNQWARMLKSNHSNLIGLCITGFANPYEMHISFYAQQYIVESGYQLHLASLGPNVCSAAKAIRDMQSLNVAGVIASLYHYDKLREVYKSLDIPVIIAPGKCSEEDFDWVDTDHDEATYNAVMEMAKKHRRIGFISGDPYMSTSIARLEGYQRALRDSRIEFDESLVACGNSTVEGGCDAARELLKNNDITAIFAANNLMMQGAIQVINEIDISLYDRLALVGFDDEPWYPLIRPSITAIRQPLREIVQTATQYLLSRIENPDSPRRYAVIPAEFIRRASF